MDRFIDFTKGGMHANKEAHGFTLYTSPVWTMQILMGRPGKAYHPDLVNICPSLELGSIAMQIDIMDGGLISAAADQGDRDFPYPGESTRLVIATADPMRFTAPQLRAIATAIQMGTQPTGLSEVALSQAAEYLHRLRDMKIGRFPAGVVSCL
jgi:hypothetical protein